MGWRQNLRPGRIGGVDVHTTDRDLSGGRRIKNHEYPKRDQNYPEDMGGKTNKWSVNAYVIGDDYMRRRDALVRICESGRSVQYSDHWGRSGLVVVETYNLKESSQEGRMARFKLTLIRAGTASASPVAIAATATILSGAAASLTQGALGAFKSRYLR